MKSQFVLSVLAALSVPAVAHASQMDCHVEVHQQLVVAGSDTVYMQRMLAQELYLNNKDSKEAKASIPIFGSEPWYVTNNLPGLSNDDMMNLMKSASASSIGQDSRYNAIAIDIFAPHGGFLGIGQNGSWSHAAPAMININSPSAYTGVGGESSAESFSTQEIDICKEDRQLHGDLPMLNIINVENVSSLNGYYLGLGLNSKITVSCQ